MNRCLEFGAWADAVRGDMPGPEGFRAAEHLRECPACRRELRDARRLVQALSPVPPTSALGDPSQSHDRHEDLAALAAAIARGEFPASAWKCEDCVEILLASIESTRAGSRADGTFDARTARHGGAARIHARRPTRYWIAGTLAAAAAAAFAFVALGPASQDWARSAGLRRVQVWRLPKPLAEEVRRVASGGALTPPRFTLPSGPIDIERDPDLGPSAPRVQSPRWETSLDVRPEFHWSGSGARAEVFLLDGDRKFLWSATSDAEGRLSFPATEAPLARGATYYWKVNFLDDERVRPSAYAGFTVLTDEEAARCRDDLDRAGSTRFVEAVVAERCGLYTRAAQSFDAASRSIEEPDIATRLARELRLRQGLDDEAERR